MAKPKRKHRVVVEVTLERPGTAKDAARALDDIIKGGPHSFRSITKIAGAKEFNRVFRAELRAKQEAYERIFSRVTDYE